MTRQVKTTLQDIETDEIYVQADNGVNWINQTTKQPRLIAASTIGCGKRFIVVKGDYKPRFEDNRIGTTIDNYPFYEGDYPWVVNRDLKVYKWSSYTKGIMRHYRKDFLIFHSEIAAQKYANRQKKHIILGNKICDIECLSVNDVAKVFASLKGSGPWSSVKLEQLITLVTNKQSQK